MQMIPVASSNLAAVGYDEQSATLYIQFHSGRYMYFDVPVQVFQGLLSAPSKGKYHHQYIKNVYRYQRY